MSPAVNLSSLQWFTNLPDTVSGFHVQNPNQFYSGFRSVSVFVFTLTVKTQPPDRPTVNGTNVFWSRGAKFPKDIEDYEFQVQITSGHKEWEVSMSFN